MNAGSKSIVDTLGTIDDATTHIERVTPTDKPFSNQSQRIFLICDKNSAKDRKILVENLCSAAVEIDCIISYIETPDKNVDDKTLHEELQETDLLILLVTQELLDSIAYNKIPEFVIAQKMSTPILPIAKELTLFFHPVFKEMLGTICGIDLYDFEYLDKLKTQLESLLAPSKLDEEIYTKAFSAKIFLGYRSEDREAALKFMRKFHNLPRFEAVSIWYDKYLPVSKPSDEGIKNAITNSDLFTLLVTPNIVKDEDSYVRTVEYPFAKDRKPVISVEARRTKIDIFAKLFPDVVNRVKLWDTAFYDKFTSKLKDVCNRTDHWAMSSKRAYLLGNAYLYGRYVEKNFDKAVKLLAIATDEHLAITDHYKSAILAATQLADVYANGIYTKIGLEDDVETAINYDEALKWRIKAANFHEKVLGMWHQETAAAYNDIADIYKNKGQYDEALLWYSKGLTIQLKMLGKYHSETTATCNNIALTYDQQGKYTEALEWCDKALVTTGTSDKVLVAVAITYNTKALIYKHLGKFDEALTEYHKALMTMESVLGKNHPNTLTISNNIAVIHDNKGEYEKAVEVYRRVLDVRERMSGKNHPDTAITCSNIALTYDHQGKYQKALTWYRKALTITEKVLGKNHPNTLTIYNNIATVDMHQGLFEKALEQYLKVLTIRKKVLGNNHLDTAGTYNNIAIVYMQLDKLNDALKWHKKALTIRKKVLSKDHQHVATSYQNIANVYMRMGRFDDSLELYRKVLVIAEKALGKGHPDIATTYNNIALTYDHQGKYQKALTWYKKALTIRKKVFGKNHPFTAVIYDKIASIHMRLGMYKEALDGYMTALVVYESILGKDHPTTATIHSNIATVYHHETKYTEALEWYLKSYQIFKKIRDTPNTGLLKENMVDTYNSAEFKEPFESWLEKNLAST
ncbi:MAG: tetratricopeptide repeat protein [Nitrososphaerota archaeon]|jgi:tetratricopeptide (TPR) repeat protein|nr:tetratricopeptide repeat protein [Nitrososphaerota archaeon]